VSFLLDTNVVSEWVKQRPDPGVVTWLAEVDEDRVFLSVVTLAELRYGIDRLADGNRRRRLDVWLRDEIPLRFQGRLLPVDQAIAESWGQLVAQREAAGRRIAVIDAFIAATANVHGLKLVTRNESDFRSAVNEIINPWKSR
jgi:predicted nucleic acid-binding protein